MTKSEKYQKCREIIAGLAYDERPIRLADVLRAIENRETKPEEGEIEYSAYGNLFHIGRYERIGRNGYYSKCYWPLASDSLADCDEATYDFLLAIFEK